MNIVHWLWKFGHFANQAFPDVLNVTRETLDKLEVTHKLVQQAILSLQKLDINFPQLVIRRHGREANYDGLIGPATMKLMELDRCNCPDYIHPDELEQNNILPTNDENIAFAGTGSWPKGCVPGYENYYAVRVDINTANQPSVWRQHQTWILQQCYKAQTEIGSLPIWVLNGVPERAELSTRWQNIPGGVIGWNHVLTNAICGQTLYGRLDNSWNANKYMQARLLLHEVFGHGFGMGHTRGGIMNPSILNGPLSWLPPDPAYRYMKQWFGGKQIILPDEPPIEPEPEPEPEPTDPQLLQEILDAVIADLQASDKTHGRVGAFNRNSFIRKIVSDNCERLRSKL